MWSGSIHLEAAVRMRRWHDVTADYELLSEDSFLIPASEPAEVMCHNDFAPYNSVFENGDFSGLIDFDVYSLGSRIWDLSIAQQI